MSINRYASLGLVEIASATGISISHISRIFGGSRKPSFEVAERIAEYLEIEVSQFYADLKAGNIRLKPN